jgi:hypothetical protein
MPRLIAESIHSGRNSLRLAHLQALSVMLIYAVAFAELALGQTSDYRNSFFNTQVAQIPEPADDVLEGNTQPATPEPSPVAEGQAPSASSKCTPKKMAELKKAAATAYKDPFYDNSFKYLNDPCYDDWHLGECAKQLHPFSCCHNTLDLGGQYRLRFQDEINMRGLGLTGLSDQFLLKRLRLYANWVYSDWLRVYGEYLDASSDFEDLPPRLIEENPSEILNLFADIRLLDYSDGEWWGRVGRQEMLYGSQRLISPLDWANTRRTFDGAKIYWRGEDWNIDGFWLRPLAFDPEGLDSPDGTQEFYGIWATYKGVPNHIYDLYWLGYNDYDAPYAAASSFKFQTAGCRVLQDKGPWMYEIEGGYQFGPFGDLSHSAGFCTVGGGRKFQDFLKGWKPNLWVYYDWASGSRTIGNGFNHLFPLGHKYLGFMDFYARTNIQDCNMIFDFQPAERWKCLLWWHCFFLANSNDVPYRINETPFVTTPGGSTYLGQELDLLATWNMTDRMSWLFGYSHFFTGDWYRTNPTPPPFAGDADFVYVQFQVNF